MSLLRALVERYDREADAGCMPVPGYSPAQIGWYIVLDQDGEPVECHPFRTDDKKPRPRTVMAPTPPKRSSGVASGAFWDKTSYVLGVTAIDPAVSPERQARDAARCAQRHAAFRARHELLLAGVEDEGFAALLAFLRAWSPDRYDALPDLPDGALDQNLAFQLDGEDRFIHDRLAARMAIAAEAAKRHDGETGPCLVTGKTGSVARLHPSIKGVPGAQSSGAALVSFNLDAFESWGKTQGFNAPVSEEAAEGYAAALNGLISSTRGVDAKGFPLWTNRVRLGGDTVVFWAETQVAEALTSALLDQTAVANSRTVLTETVKVRDVMQALEELRPLETTEFGTEASTRVHIVGLSPNAARLSVRFYYTDTLGAFTCNIQDHWRDLAIQPAPKDKRPDLWRVCIELAAQGEAKNVADQLAGELTRAVLQGADYPYAMLLQALMRVRADQQCPPLRAALIKAALVRPLRLAAARNSSSWKDPLVSLDREETNVGYRLGRLFALVDYAQYLSVGEVNAGVKDKFFASASATPARVFPSILRNAQNHLSDARKSPEKKRRAQWADTEMKQVIGGLRPSKPFPATLKYDDQGRFIVGFYHQRGGRTGDQKANSAEDIAPSEIAAPDTNDANETEDA